MKNIYLKKTFCSALAAGVAIAGLNAPVQTDAKTTTKKSIDNMSVMSRVVSKNNDGLLRYSYVDENGKKIDFDGSSASLPSTRKKATSVPSSYDLRKYGQTTSIKDQGVTGSCWAFAAVKAMESNSILNGLNTIETADYSESHLTWYSYNPITNTQSPMYGDGCSIKGTDLPSGVFNPFGQGQTLNAYDAGGNALSAIFTLAAWSGAKRRSSTF